jgi:hypothetical protein
MPTIARADAYRIFFYGHEPNEPPHVHVERERSEAKLWLEPDMRLARNRGLPRARTRAYPRDYPETPGGVSGGVA